MSKSSEYYKNHREEIIQKLVDEFGEKASSFNNTLTNKQREKFWTYNRLRNFLIKKENRCLCQ